jgi:hypothetical protein
MDDLNALRAAAEHVLDGVGQRSLRREERGRVCLHVRRALTPEEARLLPVVGGMTLDR